MTGNLEGEEPRSATLIARLAYEDVAVTRELGTFTPAIVTNAEIDAAIDFMGRVKADYAAALLGVNASLDEVVDDLDTFQSASPAEDGSIVWARTSTDCDDTGVVPVDLPGYDPMGTAQWRLFRSSRPSVVAHENLLVTQPAYNTKVRIDSTLTYKAFESLAEAHPQNIKLQQLVNQPVSAMYTVLGTTGAENPEAGRTLTVNARVTGLDAVKDDGTREQRDWIPLTEVTVPAEEGATAWDVFSGLLDEAGYTYALNAAGPMSITTPDGITLDNDFNKPYRYWAFFIDGEYGQGAEGAATTCPVRDGMAIELRYLDDGVTVLPQADVIVNPDAEHPDLDAQWNGFINGGTGSVTEALTPTSNGELAWAENLLTHEEVEANGKLFASDPLIIDGKIYIVTASEVQDPETWRPIHSLARLQVVDRSTGKIEREVQLGSTMDSTCRPAYADGIIVIPLSGGYLQAVSAKTLETIWVVPAASKGQSLCTLTVRDGYVYVAMFDSLPDKLAVGGSVRRFNIRTGALAGDMRTDASGYYWAGGVMVGDYFAIGDDQGQVHVFTADLSREVSSRKIADASIRSTLVLSEGFVYAVSQQDGTLHKLIVDNAGNVEELSSVKFADTSTSTPTISGGRAFIGGFKGNWKNKNGVLAVVDLESMNVQQVLKADGEKGYITFSMVEKHFPKLRSRRKREIEKKMPVVALGCAVMVIFGSAVGKRMTDQSKEKGKIIQADEAREQEGATLENFGYTEKLEEVVWKISEREQTIDGQVLALEIYLKESGRGAEKEEAFLCLAQRYEENDRIDDAAEICRRGRKVLPQSKLLALTYLEILWNVEGLEPEMKAQVTKGILTELPEIQEQEQFKILKRAYGF